MTTTLHSPGRLGNQIFRNIITSEIAKQNDLKVVEYGMFNQIQRLGIKLYTTGTNIYNDEVKITDDTCMKYIHGEEHVNCNINTCDNYFQTPDTARYVYQYLTTYEQKTHIMENNIYKERYDSNEDLFIHLRLGDAVFLHPNMSYFDEAISKCVYSTGYLSTENYSHPFCQELMKKYKLRPLPSFMDEVHTIMFASTCRNIILCTGTYSWVIGVLGYFSKVIYPEMIEAWTGDIYVIPEWIEILRPNHELHSLFDKYNSTLPMQLTVRKSKKR